MDSITDIKRRYDGKLVKGYDEGLGYTDYKSLCKCLAELKKIGLNDPKVKELYNSINALVLYLVKNGAASKFSKQNREYIKAHSLLLPLAMVDSCDRAIDEDDDSIFYFDFDNDEEGKKKESIVVKELSNGYLLESQNINQKKCHDIIDYLYFMHGFKLNDSLELLCRVFKFQLPPDKNTLFSWHKVQEVADSYRKGVTYKGLPELIDNSRIAVSNLQVFQGRKIKDIYRERLEIIDRVSRGEFDKEFEFKEPPKVKLKK